METAITAAPFRVLLPPLWRKPRAHADQRRFITAPQRISVAGTGTKTGKTLGCAEWIVANAAAKTGTLWWWIAPSHYQAGIGFGRAKELLPPERFRANESTKTIFLNNGSTIEFKTGEKPNLLFGQAVHGAVVDEASRMKEQAWVAIQTTMTQTRGPIRVASNTDQGRNNWFYHLYQKGLLKNPDGSKRYPDIVSWSIKTYENPHISAASFRDLVDTLPPIAYEALVEAVFPEDALTVFRNVDGCVVDDPPGWDGKTPIIQKARFDRTYAIGVDLAKYSDYTVIVVIDIETGEIVYYQRINLRLWETQMERVSQVSEYYNGAQVLVDSTGVGDPIYERLSLLNVPVVPYKFTNPSKQRLVDNLAIGIEKQAIEIPVSLEQLIEELKMYEYRLSVHGNISFSAPERDGAYDDSVMGLALAYFSAAQPFAVGYVTGERRDALESELMRSDRSKAFKKDRGF